MHKCLDLLFPHNCVLCGHRGHILCLNCYQLIQFYPQQLKRDLRCTDFIDQVLILGYYQPPLKNLIKALKYQHNKSVANILANLCYFHLAPIPADIVTYVPISRLRKSNRGYNQAKLIALKFASLNQVPCIELIKKTKHTVNQAKLKSAIQREKNLKDSFELAASKQMFINKKVLIVDDVVSTGATINSCAKVLKQNGAKRISALVLARS